MNLKNKIETLEKKYRLISDNLRDVIWVIDAQTRQYEYITPSIEKMTGYTPEEYMNATIEKFILPEHTKKILKLLAADKQKFLEQGANVIRELEVERINKDGSINWIEIRARLYQEKGGAIKIVGVTRDITERKTAELKQNELIERLGQALAEKEKLLQENKVLKGLLPICSGCKRIRNEDGKWWPLDAYVKEKTSAKLTHTICEDCEAIYYGDLS